MLIYTGLVIISLGLPLALLLGSCCLLTQAGASLAEEEGETRKEEETGKDPIQVFEGIMAQVKGMFNSEEEKYIRDRMYLLLGKGKVN